jgi:hypothetical protein
VLDLIRRLEDIDRRLHNQCGPRPLVTAVTEALRKITAKENGAR